MIQNRPCDDFANAPTAGLGVQRDTPVGAGRPKIPAAEAQPLYPDLREGGALSGLGTANLAAHLGSCNYTWKKGVKIDCVGIAAGRTCFAGSLGQGGMNQEKAANVSWKPETRSC